MRRHFFWGRPTAFRLEPRLFPRRHYPPGYSLRRPASQEATGRGLVRTPEPGLTLPEVPDDGSRPPVAVPEVPLGAAPWRKLALGLTLVAVLAAAALFLLDVLLWPTLRTLAEAEIQNMATTGMYRAVQVEMTESGLDYRSLFRVETDTEGQVTFMQPDTIAVNNLAGHLTLAVQAEMVAMDGRKVYIPLGRALGSRLLGWMGPRIGVKISPVAVTYVRIWDTFESAGINQTRHRLYVNVRVMTKTAIPFIGSDYTIEGDFPIAEAVIVGRVPNTYVGGVWVPFYPRDAGDSAAPEGSSPPGSSTGP